MRSFSLFIILWIGSLCFAQFAGSEELEVFENLVEEQEELEQTDHSDFTRGTFLDADTSYKSNYTGEEYTYREPKTSEPKEPIKRPDLNIGPLIGFIFKALLVIVGIALLYFLYISLSNLRLQRNAAKNRVVATHEAEKDLTEPEELNDGSLEALLKRAKTDGDHILATRYYFLMYLKKLQDVGVIKYHRDKTNADYLSEITNPKLSEQFIKLSYMYEYAWYGKKEITDELFATVEQTFIHQIGNVK